MSFSEKSELKRQEASFRGIGKEGYEQPSYHKNVGEGGACIKKHVQGNNSVGISAGREEGYIKRAEI